MAGIDVDEYARSLYSRVDDTQVLKRAVIENGDWEPQANTCHHNVSMWCELKADFIPVRGWLYFDLPGLSYVKFVAHSAVRAPDGGLYDITPSNASQDYPFISGELSEQEFADLVEVRGYGELCCVTENV